MLHKQTVTFLTQLADNNNKPWFDEHRDAYATAKLDFENTVNKLLEETSVLEPALREQKAKDCVFRIFRDVRFSKDKTPYKAHFGAYLSKGGRKYEGAGYYLHIEPGGKSFAGGGLWMPEPALLKKVRQEIDYNTEEFQAIVDEPTFRKYFRTIEGEKLKNPPQGYAADHPAIDYLRLKSITVGASIADEDLTSPNLLKKCVAMFTAMRPLVDFLNRGMD